MRAALMAQWQSRKGYERGDACVRALGALGLLRVQICRFHKVSCSRTRSPAAGRAGRNSLETRYLEG